MSGTHTSTEEYPCPNKKHREMQRARHTEREKVHPRSVTLTKYTASMDCLPPKSNPSESSCHLHCSSTQPQKIQNENINTYLGCINTLVVKCIFHKNSWKQYTTLRNVINKPSARQTAVHQKAIQTQVIQERGSKAQI